jgi:hypothetical protein
MSDIKFEDVTKWKIVPINTIRIGGYYEGNNQQVQAIYFSNLAEGSQWTLSPVTRQDDTGMDRIIAWKFEGSFIVIESDYGETDKLDMFDYLSDFEVGDFDIWLMPGYNGDYDEEQPNGEILTFSVSSSYGNTLLHKSWGVTFSITETAESPKLTINIKGIFSSDLFKHGATFITA